MPLLDPLTEADGIPTVSMIVGDRRDQAASGKVFSTVNPATGETVAHLPEGGPADIDRAVTAARAAFEGPWSRMKPYERARLIIALAGLLEAERDSLTRLETIDMGAPLARTRAMFDNAVLPKLYWFAGQVNCVDGETIRNSVPGEFLSYTTREPVGVVGAIIPWNAPLASCMWKIGPVLASGCTVVLKPAEQASLTPLRFAELCLEAGIPPGVVNVVTGGGEAGAALARHPGVDKVAFTGSVSTGQDIVRASAGNLKRLTLELGGKSANIVFADADVELAARGAAAAAFNNSGQICSAGTRLFVEAPIYELFVEKLAEVTADLTVGNGLDEGVDLGPLVSQQQLDRVNTYLDLARAEGASVHAGGDRPSDGALAAGYFITPTILVDVRDQMRVAREEIFGPVVCALPFTDLDEVATRANDSDYGLGGGVWTTDLSRAHQIADRLRTGSIWVNCYQVTDSAVPFGGFKMSGYGREGGREHLAEYLTTRSVWVRTG